MPSAQIYGKSSLPVTIELKSGDINLNPAESLDYIYKLSDAQSADYVTDELIAVKSGNLTISVPFPDLTEDLPELIVSIDGCPDGPIEQGTATALTVVHNSPDPVDIQWQRTTPSPAIISSAVTYNFPANNVQEAQFLVTVTNTVTNQSASAVCDISVVETVNAGGGGGGATDNDSRYLEILNQVQPNSNMLQRTGHANVTGGTNITEVSTWAALLSALRVEGNCVLPTSALADTVIVHNDTILMASNVTFSSRNAPGLEIRREQPGLIFNLSNFNNIIVEGPRISAADLNVGGNSGISGFRHNNGRDLWLNRMTFALPENDAIGFGSGNSSQHFTGMTMSNIHFASDQSKGFAFQNYQHNVNQSEYGRVTMHGCKHEQVERVMNVGAGQAYHIFNTFINNVDFVKIQLKNDVGASTNSQFKILAESLHFHKSNTSGLRGLIRILDEAVGPNTGVYTDDIRLTGDAELVTTNGNEGLVVPKSSSLNGGAPAIPYSYVLEGSANVQSSVDYAGAI